ncbi:ABC transporter ATP-binding protein [Agromyces salentinus]|uniref:ABC transporter ATP-binding protein n=1 Tax=Agromyces salentinus TaxID=269421 RepID=A0ABN2MZY2_9MICO|nr:ABC transporter ATP-binding protein [Agromyces salentinus]
MSIISLEGVGRTVERPDAPPLTILSSVDLEIADGDRVSVVGRSGSGKSTLLNLLGLLDRPTQGTIRFDGAEVRRLSDARLARLRGASIGFVFQQFNLLPGRTAIENVMTPLLYDRGTAFWRRERLATEMLGRVGLGERITSMPDRMSGGEQQRVAIARALVRRPRLILADEPTGALDLETGGTVMALMEEVARETGAALVTITHDPAIARRAVRHLRLDAGVISPLDDEPGPGGTSPADATAPIGAVERAPLARVAATETDEVLA